MSHPHYCVRCSALSYALHDDGRCKACLAEAQVVRAIETPAEIIEQWADVVRDAVLMNCHPHRINLALVEHEREKAVLLAAVGRPLSLLPHIEVQ